MNSDQRNCQFMFEKALEPLGEATTVYVDGLTDAQKGSLYEAERLMMNVLEELQEDSENPDSQ